AERALLRVLDGSCRTPIAALATLHNDGTMTLEGKIAKPDGSEVLSAQGKGNQADADTLGKQVGEELKTRAGPNFLTI
ncbi:MAG: hydroxymethylbilane synthase, partial [Alphaproteobacteria bacterium]|nr:hydroxymethylbilane synthase [Alphaproteobacteria bacterium]